MKKKKTATGWVFVFSSIGAQSLRVWWAGINTRFTQRSASLPRWYAWQPSRTFETDVCTLKGSNQWVDRGIWNMQAERCTSENMPKSTIGDQAGSRNDMWRHLFSPVLRRGRETRVPTTEDPLSCLLIFSCLCAFEGLWQTLRPNSLAQVLPVQALPG